MKQQVKEVRPFSDAALDRLLKAIDEAYGIQIAGVTPTPDGSCLSDFPAYLGAKEKLSELLGFPLNGDEFLYEIAARIEEHLKQCEAFESTKGSVGFGYTDGEIAEEEEEEGVWSQCKNTDCTVVHYGLSPNQKLIVCERHACYALHIASMVLELEAPASARTTA